MNIQAMMAQARKIQGEIERSTKEIESTIYKYENDNILIETSGKNEVKRIEIKNDDILADKELLADILTVGINNTLEKKERLLQDETNSNNQFIKMSSDIGFKQRQLACEQMNQMFGLNVTVRETQDEFESEVIDNELSYNDNRGDGE